MDLSAIGSRIKVARERKHLTQEDLAAIVGLSPTHISVIDCGVKPPNRRPKHRDCVHGHVYQFSNLDTHFMLYLDYRKKYRSSCESPCYNRRAGNTSPSPFRLLPIIDFIRNEVESEKVFIQPIICSGFHFINSI